MEVGNKQSWSFNFPCDISSNRDISGGIKGRVLASSQKEALKKLKRYVDDMFETKGRQLVKTKIDGENITFCFCGRDIYFTLKPTNLVTNEELE